MASSQSVLEALTLLSNISELEKIDVVSHRSALKAAFINLQNILRTVATTDETNRGSTKLLSIESNTSILGSSGRGSAVVSTGSQSPAGDELSESRIFQDIETDVSISGSACIPEESRFQAGKATESENEDESKVLVVLDTLNNRKVSILNYLSSTAKDAVSTPTDWPEEDPRLVDIQLASKRSTNEAKFRAGLARLSLANAYLLWEKEKYQTSRVDTLILDLASNDKRHHVREYVTSNSLFKSKRAGESILRGIKYRVFEKIYGSKGVSSFLIFANQQFRALPYRLLPLLAEKIKGSESWHGLAEDKSKWMEECQALYEERINRYSCSKRAFAEPPHDGPRKRPRTTEPCHNTREYQAGPDNVPVDCHSELPPVNDSTAYQSGLDPTVDFLGECDPLGYPHFPHLPQNTDSAEYQLLLDPPADLLGECDPLGYPHFPDPPPVTSSIESVLDTPAVNVLGDCDPLEYPHFPDATPHSSSTPPDHGVPTPSPTATDNCAIWARIHEL